MEKFNIIQPSVLLTPYIKHYWTLEIDSHFQAKERVIPVGNIQLIFHKGDRMYSLSENKLHPRSFISGQTTQFQDVSPSGKLHMLVVVFHPFGAHPFFHIPLGKISEYKISLQELEDKDIKELENKVLNAEDDKTSIQYIEAFFLNRLHYFQNYNFKRIYNSIQAANTYPNFTVSSLADISFLSEKQFNRVFTSHVGLSPKKFLRILRFQRALYQMQINPHINLAQLSFASGFYDQSHLIKEFKILSGYTPLEYLRICTPYSDYFSL